MSERNHEIFMRRCFDLARLGEQSVKTNPMVGSVLVYEEKIIGEGYHKAFGADHAEIMAIQSVAEQYRGIVSKARLYISLEPCNYFGKTPPCVERIVSEQIKSVIISCRDPNPMVSGNGIQYLKNHEVNVIEGVLENDGRFLIRKFSHWIRHRKPFITLKWAQSRDGKFGLKDQQVWLSHPYSRIFVHRLRSVSAGIMVGTNTALIDHPRLDNRFYTGPSPIRIISDRQSRIGHDHPFFHDGIPTVFYSKGRELPKVEHVDHAIIDFSNDSLQQIISDLGGRAIYSVLVEGGAKLLRAFISQNLWNEAYVIRSNKTLGEGFAAPVLHGKLIEKFKISDDEIIHVQNDKLKSSSQ